MIKDITIGQYYKTESILHQLDARVKLFATMIFVISLFIERNVFNYVVAATALFCLILVSRVPIGYMLRGLKPIAVVLLFSIIINMLFTPGIPLITFFGITITIQGIKLAIYIGCRYVLLILGSSLMTFTTTPNELTDGLEKAFTPLAKIKMPVHEVAMMMSITLRFIPILTEELDKITKAQLARGADFEEGNLFHRMKGYVPILVPLFVAAIRRANDLALAMESRCYQGGQSRTKMKPLQYKKRDAIAYAIIFTYLGVMIVGAFL